MTIGPSPDGLIGQETTAVCTGVLTDVPGILVGHAEDQAAVRPVPLFCVRKELFLVLT
ncbi:hypothetical protein ABEX25_24010 [Paenibacillus thiaminolyticus]|uniref:hypothetical protein n=1 Tax=Paenibacillus thiaminolyticus TaxID=49283 RepID=UPI003D2C02EE